MLMRLEMDIQVGELVEEIADQAVMKAEVFDTAKIAGELGWIKSRFARSREQQEIFRLNWETQMEVDHPDQGAAGPGPQPGSQERGRRR